MLVPKPPAACWAFAIGKAPIRVAAGDDVGAMPGWLASALEPSRFPALASSQGSVLTSEIVDGRPALVVEVRGLRGKMPLRLWVDAGIGTIVRMERTDDAAPLLVLDGLDPAGEDGGAG
jgi:hypothetical protein